MGFGFTLFTIFILLPGTIILLIFWIIFRKRMYGFLLGGLWAFLILSFGLLSIIGFFIQPTTVEKDDVHGQYVIDRQKYSGKQADWQYNHYRLEITPDDSLFFHETEGEKIIKTYKKRIDFVDHRIQALWTFENENDTFNHHIIKSTPTLFRETFDFYYAFKSDKYGNVFVRRGTWKKIED